MLVKKSTIYQTLKKIASNLKLLKNEEIIDKTSGKVHKETKNKLALFCPILSGIHLLTN